MSGLKKLYRQSLLIDSKDVVPGSIPKIRPRKKRVNVDECCVFSLCTKLHINFFRLN